MFPCSCCSSAIQPSGICLHDQWTPTLEQKYSSCAFLAFWPSTELNSQLQGAAETEKLNVKDEVKKQRQPLLKNILRTFLDFVLRPTKNIVPKVIGKINIFKMGQKMFYSHIWIGCLNHKQGFSELKYG